MTAAIVTDDDVKAQLAATLHKLGLLGLDPHLQIAVVPEDALVKVTLLSPRSENIAIFDILIDENNVISLGEQPRAGVAFSQRKHRHLSEAFERVASALYSVAYEEAVSHMEMAVRQQFGLSLSEPLLHSSRLACWVPKAQDKQSLLAEPDWIAFMQRLEADDLYGLFSGWGYLREEGHQRFFLLLPAIETAFPAMINIATLRGRHYLVESAYLPANERERQELTGVPVREPVLMERAFALEEMQRRHTQEKVRRAKSRISDRIRLQQAADWLYANAYA